MSRSVSKRRKYIREFMCFLFGHFGNVIWGERENGRNVTKCSFCHGAQWKQTTKEEDC